MERDILFCGVITCMEFVISPLFLQIAPVKLNSPQGRKKKDMKAERSLIKRSLSLQQMVFPLRLEHPREAH